MRIVIAEDDGLLRRELVETFARQGYDAVGVEDYRAPVETVLALEPRLLVLDINLPGCSGFDLCRSLKARADFPILILTARDALGDELAALGLGADDYLTKPCHPRRLLARAERLLQTYGKVRGVIQTGTLLLDTESYKVSIGGQCRTLPETEGRILRALMERTPEVVSQQALLQAVWGTAVYVDENILQVNMTRLRRHLGEIGLEGAIQTFRGQGYRLEVELSWEKS